MITKRMLQISLAAAALSALAGTTLSAPIVPNGTIFTAAGEAKPAGPGVPPPVGAGVPVADITSPVLGADFAGSLRSIVIAGDTTNALGGLTFVYVYTALPSLNTVGRITFNGFSGWLTDSSYSSLTLGVAPSVLTRSAGAGDVMGFNFTTGPNPDTNAIASLQMSRWLVVQTNSAVFNPNVAAVIDGTTDDFVPILAPNAIPAPGAMALVGLGGLIVGRRRR